MSEDEKVSKEVLELHMKQIRGSLHDIREGLSATALISKTVTENALHLVEVKERLEKAEDKTDDNEKNIIELNTHKRYLTVISMSFMGLLVAWIKSKV